MTESTSESTSENTGLTRNPPKCKRCKENDGILLVRKDNICNDCFDKYLRTKCVKRMESYRVRYSSTASSSTTPPRTLLLPLSFGLSSTTLLHFLDVQLKTQKAKSAKTGFELIMLYVDDSSIDPSSSSSSRRERQEHLEVVGKRFPEAGRYVFVGLEEIYNFRSAVRDIESENIKVPVGKESGGDDDNNNNIEALKTLITALPSKSSRTDILNILRTRLIVEIAKGESCEAVLWGDSTTRLAEKTLSETAKGRGFSVPWQTMDGVSPYGITFNYPLRDILKSELKTYVSISSPPPSSSSPSSSTLPPSPLLPLCISYSPQPKHTPTNAASGRNITIDELMVQYFETIETQYPSIVANVSRMSEKLVPPPPPPEGDSAAAACGVCGLPGDGSGGEMTLSALSLNSGVGGKKGTGNENGKKGCEMCYGCARALHGAQSLDWPLGDRP